MTNRQACLVVTLSGILWFIGCASLGVPRLLSPEEGAVWTVFPHIVDFEWMPVPGAAGYRIEFDGYYCGPSMDKWCSEVNGRVAMTHDMSAPRYHSNNELLGNQPWRWRVSVINKQGRSGPPTEWRQIVFTLPQPVPPVTSSFIDPATRQPITGSGVVGPRPIYQPRAQYPTAAAKLKENPTGNVGMEVVVDAEGRVQDVRVTKSLRPDFDERAVAAVKMWQFEPARRDGKPLPATIYIEMGFSIR